MAKKRISIVIRVLVSIGLLVLLFKNLDFKHLMVYYKSLRVDFLVVALLFLLLQTLISTVKWRQILRSDHSSLPLLFLWKTTLIGSFLSLFLPSNVGGDVYRVYAVRQANKSLGKSTSSVVFDRLTGVFALISIAFIASAFLPLRHYNWMIVAAYLLILVGFLLVTSNRTLVWLSRFEHRWSRFPLKILKSLHAYRKDHGKLVGILLISFVFHISIVVISKIYTVALGMDIPFWQLMVIIPLISLAEALPVSINGFGVREGAFAFFFSLIGQTREEGLAVSLLVVFMRYLLGLIGGILLLYTAIQSREKMMPEERVSEDLAP